MDSILLAVDGSDHSEKAAEMAIDLAAKSDAKLSILHVLDEHPLSEAERSLAEVEYAGEIKKYASASTVETVRGFGKTGMQSMLLQHAETNNIIRTALGEGLIARYRRDADAAGIKDVDTRLETGDPASTILTSAKKCNADMIVLGSRGQSDVRGLLLGSVSHKVANMSEITVVTVK